MLWENACLLPLSMLNFSLSTSLLSRRFMLRPLCDRADSERLCHGFSLLFFPSRSFPLLKQGPSTGCPPSGVYSCQRGFIHEWRWSNSSCMSYPCLGCLLCCGTPLSLTFTIPLLLPTRSVFPSSSFCPFLHSFSPTALLTILSHFWHTSSAEHAKVDCNRHRCPLIFHRDCSCCFPSNILPQKPNKDTKIYY